MSTTTITNRTVAHMTSHTGVDIVSDWADDFEIPVLAGIQRQGDVIVVPDPHVNASTQVTTAGTPVVRGESGGNTHAIYADGPDVRCDTFAASPTSLRVATLTVPEGSAAYLSHPEHGFLGIAPGRYEIRRQREQADELRMVAD